MPVFFKILKEKLLSKDGKIFIMPLIIRVKRISMNFVVKSMT